MEQQNEGIKELFKPLDSKTFTDNQKEKLTWHKLDEVKALLTNVTKQLSGLSASLKKNIMDIGDVILAKVRVQSSIIEDHCQFMELKTENNSLELKHMMEQRFLEQDNKLDIIQKD
ncbi:hypothetical protein Dimus_016279, partial [Dionaea muscipula]